MRKLGNTGLMISEVGFGGIPIQRTKEDAIPALFDALQREGINFIDTARGYTVSEEYIGRALAGRRDKFVLATKSMARIASLSHRPPAPPDIYTPFFKVINRQDDNAISLCASINAYCFASLSVKQMSSASMRAMYLPFASDMALFKDAGSLKFTSLVCTLILSSFCEKS